MVGQAIIIILIASKCAGQVVGHGIYFIFPNTSIVPFYSPKIKKKQKH